MDELREQPPEDIPEYYDLTTLDQLRTIADALRMRVLEALTEQGMTVTQVGELLGESPAKMHYHVRELVRVGLVRQVATREKGAILEKYYRAVARNLHVTNALLRTSSSDDLPTVLRAFLEQSTGDFIQAASAVRFKGVGLGSYQIWVPPDTPDTDEHNSFFAELADLLERYKSPRGVAGEQERTLVWFAYDPHLVPSTGTVAEAEAEAEGDEGVATSAATQPEAKKKPRITHTVVVGAVSYLRPDLEGVVARGNQMDISVLGACTFADDITPELADRAIARFRHRGLLHASDAVREVLKRKAQR